MMFDMSDSLVALLGVFGVVRRAFTRPGYNNAMIIFCGWVQTNGVHAVTQALVCTNVAGRRHWEAFHRFFSRGSWQPDQLGFLLLDRISKFLPDDRPVCVAIDDTLVSKKGAHVFGIGSHLDAVRSSKARRVFCFGHVWVVLTVTVRVPFSERPWALPILFRLYRNKKDCAATGADHRKKTQLAREMLEVLIEWADGRPIEVAMDSAYCNHTVIEGLSPSVVVLGCMRPDAALTALPELGVPRKGRTPIRGKRLQTPEAMARDGRRKWHTLSAKLYGRVRKVQYKTIDAQWYRACGKQLVRIVIVRIENGNIPIRVFFSTDTNLSPKEILLGYAQRWSIEVCFRDLKQLLGFGDSSARKREAVERTAPFIGITYTILVIWFVEGAHTSPAATPPIRPWYPHKSGLCFADILRAAQRVLATFDVLDPGPTISNLHEIPVPPENPPQGVQHQAA